jgi:arylsulfatase A-like enzyme
MAISMDWLPPLTDILQFNVSEKLDGHSLMPLIQDEKQRSPHQVLYWQMGSYDDGQAQWAVREGTWKLIGNPKDPSHGSNDVLEDKLFLVNLDMDASEKNNLASQYPEKVDALQGMHNNWLADIQKEMQK